MTTLLVNILIGMVFVLAVSGIPLWMVIKHPDTGPESAAEHRPAPLPARRPQESRVPSAAANSSAWSSDISRPAA
jgi:hypothetical protein